MIVFYNSIDIQCDNSGFIDTHLRPINTDPATERPRRRFDQGGSGLPGKGATLNACLRGPRMATYSTFLPSRLKSLTTGSGRENAFSKKLNRLPQERPVSPRYLPFTDRCAPICCWVGKEYSRPQLAVQCFSYCCSASHNGPELITKQGWFLRASSLQRDSALRFVNNSV